jgi:hypothetical protein
MKHVSTIKAALVALALVVGLTAVVTPVSASAASTKHTPCVTKEYREGTYNDTCVGTIQRMLNTVHGSKLAVDNDFGPETKAAVASWQKHMYGYSTSIMIDGVVGKQTWGTLCAERAEYTNLARRAGCGKTQATKGSTPLRHCNERTFSTSKNRHDFCVRYIHQMLNTARGVYLDPAGEFNSKTAKTVRSMQKQADLDQDRAGTIGAETWDLLCGYNMNNAYGQKIYNRYARQAGCEV